MACWWDERVPGRWEVVGGLGEEELSSDDVGGGEGFGDGVLDLEAGIDFEEVVCARGRVQKELEGAEGEVVYLRRSPVSGGCRRRIRSRKGGSENVRFSPCVQRRR